MLKKIYLTVVLLLFSVLLHAQTINVSGQYLDKKQNPINNALVSYFDGADVLIDSTRSLADGNFELTLDLTGIQNHQSNNPFLEQPHPNPFSELYSFTVNINSTTTILISDMQGLMVDKHEIKNPGVYQCTWGGKNRIGQQVNKGAYNVSLITNNQSISQKVIFNASGTQRIRSERVADNNNFKAVGRDQDRINFSKINTSLLDYFINPVAGDTTLGMIYGNAGPEETGQLIATVHIDSTNTWNLNDYFYNDEQSVYTTNHPDFIISNDSILSYAGSDLGTFAFDVVATDLQDETLTMQMQAQITVTNQQIFTCSGYYLDNLQQAIAGATISYWENGTVFCAQTRTTESGYWNMAVVTTDTNLDKISFVKSNTTELEIFFTTPLADTTFGEITGNIGPSPVSHISETYHTIDGLLSWNLNAHFSNDDQSIYTIQGNDFAITQDTLLELSNYTEGTYTTTVTATDAQDGNLTAQISVIINIEYTINIPDTDIIEDYQGNTLFANLNQYLNPSFQGSLSYTMVSQSNSTLINLSVQDSTILINNLQADSAGSSYVGIKITGTSDVDTVYFTVAVNPMPDISGYITNVFDTLNVGLAGAVIEMTLDSITFYSDATDENGFYKIQLPAVGDTAYYVCTITNGGYMPFHTWATLDAGSNDVSEDYTIIPSDFVWDLYSAGFRSIQGLGGSEFPSEYMQTTRNWLSPPNMHTSSDNSQVGGEDLTIQYGNLIYNISNILPTFNPRDVNPENIIEHEEFGYLLQDNEMGAYFDNSIPGNGVVTRIYNGPVMNKCATAYRDYIGLNGPDISTFNQELGSCFGAVLEPSQSSTYTSVFTDPAGSESYTQDDYDCATVMLDRAKVHYRNLTITGEDAYDWEMRPDEVLTWYPEDSDKKNKKNEVLTYKAVGIDGEIIEEGTYPIDQVPSRVMKMAKIIFSPEEIAAQERKEAKVGHKLKTWIREKIKPPTFYDPSQTIALSKREIRKIKREKRRSE